jgi:DNA-directed RNA polymerase specialized sigma24 family protein
MAQRSMDDQVRAYQDLVVTLAERRARRHPNERDDLIQEGLILVWTRLSTGKPVTEAAIDNRMRNWLKLRSRQLRDNPTEYERIMKIPDEEESVQR